MRPTLVSTSVISLAIAATAAAAASTNYPTAVIPAAPTQMETVAEAIENAESQGINVATVVGIGIGMLFASQGQDSGRRGQH
ncbi:hypothetical protein CC1G_13794 [Coprinopsis cinerea okayama7|uniref:Secreted protein n=1 Tax=Coprinopsis cinerea (strain Okayama-7 / 130 / ATCC MYA-4618 / FGSC 9003) TaxID=240176 RepID=D6RKA2_COPC7|nr:hypothetical protein CC1G_13794 [Coprinopsis cinerea okayama7\|eukprot:XP_002912263.1 hypothetical protein CC1G_13794 [Coprinopsis cinerea okayama7\